MKDLVMLNNKQKIEKLIYMSKDIQASFSDKKDIIKLSQWLHECNIVLSELELSKEELIYNEFKEAFNNINNLTLNQFQILIGALKAIVNQYYSTASITSADIEDIWKMFD